MSFGGVFKNFTIVIVSLNKMCTCIIQLLCIHLYTNTFASNNYIYTYIVAYLKVTYQSKNLCEGCQKLYFNKIICILYEHAKIEGKAQKNLN